MAKRSIKYQYWEKLWGLIEQNPQILVVNADNVSSKQIQDCRKELRGKAHMLFGKNTLIRAGITKRLTEPVLGDEDYESRKAKWFPMPQLDRLQALCKGNVGFVFCNGNIDEVAEIVSSHQRPAAARAGTIAPRDVVIGAGSTGLDPGMTSFFQALRIPTKIARGCIELVNEIKIVEKGKRIGNSEVALLKKLNMKPFEYRLGIESVYDNGAVYSAHVLKTTDDEIVGNFMNASNNLAGMCLEVGFPTAMSVPHNIISAFKNMVAMILDGDYSFSRAEGLKDRINNPEKYYSDGPGVVDDTGPAKDDGEGSEILSADEDFCGIFGEDDDDY